MLKELLYRRNFQKNIRSFVIIFILGFSVGVFYDANYGDASRRIIVQGQSGEQESEIVKIDTCFSPQGNCAALICQSLDSAKEEILVQAYSFTSERIAGSLISAKNRGVDVRVMADKGAFSTRGSMVGLLAQNQIQVVYDKVSGLAHNKTMIIDKSKVITGSYNFTNAADIRNSENLLIIDNKSLAKKYLDNWSIRLKNSK